VSDKVLERGQQPVGKDREAQDKWVNAVLGQDVGRLRSGAISIGKGRKPPEPPPQWTSATPQEGTPKDGPKIGEERELEGKFMKRLGEELDTIELARQIKPASPEAEHAAESMEHSLGEMHEAMDRKDFVTAGQKLDAALQFGTAVSDERVKAKDEFDKAFYPLKEQLNASLERTKGLTDIPTGVGGAETTATDAAAVAEKAAEDDDYKLAKEKLTPFQDAMRGLGTAYKDGADALDKIVTKKLGRLTRLEEGLKGTKLTTEAQAAKDALDKATLAQSNANSATPQEARLAGLVGARDQANEAEALAQAALKTKFNAAAVNGLKEIRKAAGDAVAGLTDGDPKTALADKLKEWDKEKKACDEETDLGKQKTALAKLDGDARKIMEDAAALDVTAKKDKAVSEAQGAGDIAAKIAALIQSAKNAIAALTDGDVKTKLQQAAQTSEQHYNDWVSRPDSPQKTNALGKHPPYWPGILEGALKAAAEEKRQEAFKEALKKRYGLDVNVPAGMSNTNFDQFYDMMDRLPIQQTSQDSLKKLMYDKDSRGASYNKTEARVKMGNFGAAETWPYQNPTTGDREDMRAFSINTLHEIGHAVDDKYSIMKNNGGNAGCGKWNSETLASVTQAFLDDLKSSAGSALTTDDNTLKGLIRNALTKAEVTDPTTKAKSVPAVEESDKPGTMGGPEWALVKAQLNRAVTIRAANWPWGSGKAVTLDGRAYHQAYQANTWVSYDPAARTGTEVRDYQFRAPGEWFAELYAYTWFKKVKAPGGVDKKVTKYMWSAKA